MERYFFLLWELLYFCESSNNTQADSHWTKVRTIHVGWSLDFSAWPGLGGMPTMEQVWESTFPKQVDQVCELSIWFLAAETESG